MVRRKAVKSAKGADVIDLPSLNVEEFKKYLKFLKESGVSKIERSRVIAAYKKEKKSRKATNQEVGLPLGRKDQKKDIAHVGIPFVDDASTSERTKEKPKLTKQQKVERNKVRTDRRRYERQEAKRTDKTCFQCRKPGHVLADCPEAVDMESSGIICFKCGQADHTSARCTLDTKEYRFAKCFICEEVGHLSKQCPKNTRGIYPNGGACILCNKTDHLKRNCPRILDDSEDKAEEDTTLATWTSGNVDEESNERKKPVKSTKVKKVVKI